MVVTYVLMGFLASGEIAAVRDGMHASVVCREATKEGPLASARVQSWRPTLFDIAVRGRYMKAAPGDKTVAATALSLSSLGLREGDYIGLRAEGRWFAWKGDPTPFANLGAAFMSGSRLIGPGNFGQERPFAFWDMPGNQPMGVTELDFEVPTDREVIVRIPPRATKIVFSVPDWWIGDNCPPIVGGPDGYSCASSAFGVTVFKPNSPASAMSDVTDAIADEDNAQIRLELGKIDASNLPEAKYFSLGPFSDKEGIATSPQWRGAYKSWAPEQSRYGADRGDGKKHWGWDIFAPFGSKLLAPVWPAQMTVPPHSETFGDSVVFSFQYKGIVHHIAYSHLKEIIGVERYIQGLEEVALSGCSGNASDQGCGTPYPNGTRNDHVHVGLFQRTAQPIDINACDPSGLLKWKIR